MFKPSKQTLSIIIGIFAFTAGVVGYSMYKSFHTKEFFVRKTTSGYLTVGELPKITSTSTDQVRQMLEEAFIQDRLVVSSTYQIARTNGQFVLAAPSFSAKTSDMGNCGLLDNPYCGWYRIDDSGRHLVLFGSKIAGDSVVERFVDKDHAHIRTEWSLYNFTSIEHQQLNLTNGELLPLLSIEVDQDDQSASVNISGSGIVLRTEIMGRSESTRLVPDRVDVKDQSGRIVYSLPQTDIQQFQQAISGDRDRKLKTIRIRSTNEDVISKTIHLNLYGVSYIFDLSKKTLTLKP